MGRARRLLFIGSLATALAFPGCSTLGAVNDLANAVVGTVVNTAAKALSPSTYKSSSTTTERRAQQKREDFYNQNRVKRNFNTRN